MNKHAKILCELPEARTGEAFVWDQYSSLAAMRLLPDAFLGFACGSTPGFNIRRRWRQESGDCFQADKAESGDSDATVFHFLSRPGLTESIRFHNLLLSSRSE